MKSTRLPGKILKSLGDKHTVLGLCVDRARKSKIANVVAVLTTVDSSDDLTYEESEKIGVQCFRGSENDVLARYFNAAEELNADVIVRITADCPFIDSQLIDSAIRFLLINDGDYYCNQDPNVYPDGMDVDVFTMEMLKKTHDQAKTKYDREHVTPYMKRVCKPIGKVHSVENQAHLRITLDEPEDLAVARIIYSNFSDPTAVTFKEIINFLLENQEVRELNSHIQSNEGSTMGTGPKLYKRAKLVIPGGNMLLSKRPEMFLQSGWPSYYSKAKGCEIWDLDDNKYLDMSIMGIGTNTLGYAYDPVDIEVKKCVESSNMSTLNCPEEVFLAEKLIEMHSWSDSAKFARTGGEINAIAIRIARAATGRSEVAICGYHGWHDWYLSANLSGSSTLNEHLLPGLNPEGVPRELKGLTHALRYNNFDDITILDQNSKIGVLIMEVMRSETPAPGYLESIREKCSKNGIVLIFDECTSGFRETFGGIHLKFGVEPDLATFGKAIGNGFAITALIGRKSIMDSAENTFISSTFWSERIGYVAALKTLSEMEKIRSWEVITNTGRKMQDIWHRIFKNLEFEYKVTGIPALSTFSLLGEHGNVLKTWITQEMLKKGILASNIFYPSVAHTTEHLGLYEEKLNEVLNGIWKNGKLNLLLDATPAQAGFKRLN
jgi:glutamate-1-semialdehyde 2,1-aminomutase